MHALVAGAAGFIGGALVRRLLGDGRHRPSGAALFQIAPIGSDASLRKAVAAEPAGSRADSGAGATR
jgi:nucleoside-diphosphate-sugar epimerase